MLNISLTYQSWSHINRCFQLSDEQQERPWESVYKLDLSRQTSLLLRDWRSEERWVSDSDFIATNSHKTAQPHSKLTIHFYWHTQKETASINKPIYDSLVLRFWFISDKNKQLNHNRGIRIILFHNHWKNEAEKTRHNALKIICPTFVAKQGLSVLSPKLTICVVYWQSLKWSTIDGSMCNSSKLRIFPT